MGRCAPGARGCAAAPQGRRESRGSTLLGQARRLDNGNTFLNFGGLGEMREVSPDGTTLWQLNTGLGAWFGNAVLLDTLPSLP